MLKNSLILSALAFLTTAIYLDNKLIKVSKYEIKSKKIPKEFSGFKIMHLSDFHSYSFHKGNCGIVKKIDNEKPDIIVMTGDMVNKYDEDFDKFINLAQTLSEKYPIYYIVGNHEKRLKENYLSLIIQKLSQFNIKVIDDEEITILNNNKKIHIYGLDIPLSFYKLRNRPTNINEVVDIVLRKCKEDEYNILLTHNPLFFEIYSNYNVDLTLAGHVHGGMIRLPLVGGLLSPERKFFPKYSAGIYEINNKKLIVSRGLGHSKPGIRINNMPELVSITLFN